MPAADARLRLDVEFQVGMPGITETNMSGRCSFILGHGGWYVDHAVLTCRDENVFLAISTALKIPREVVSVRTNEMQVIAVRSDGGSLTEKACIWAAHSCPFRAVMIVFSSRLYRSRGLCLRYTV